MKVTVNWLRELVPTPLTPVEIATVLTRAGIEVEGIEARGTELEGVVVAEIARVDPHPQAERLTVCAVRTAPSATHQIVCGARNMRAGDKVALATPGTQLGDGRRIEVAELRGVRSEGMLCSAVELGLGEEGDGILILDSNTQVGTPLAEALGVADTVLEVSISPNRGDCLSVLGLARELSALTGVPLSRPRYTRRGKRSGAGSAVEVRIEAPDLCHRYAARVLADVRVGPSPQWLQQRLLAVGLRPISNIVDVTNYVMIERGQPLHAFDLEKLQPQRIVVRRAGGQLSFAALDGSRRDVEADDLLITTGPEPVAIAGIIGGVDSSVADGTRNILLESAWFHPTTVRRTARRLGLVTESAYRFERHVDIEGVIVALDRAASLLQIVAGGSISGDVIDVYPQPLHLTAIPLRVSRVSDLLGMNIDRARVTSSLKALGATVNAGAPGALAVVPPSYRSDLVREIDLIEEIARVVGYDQVPEGTPIASLSAGSEGDRRLLERRLRALLAAQGWCEAVPFTFAAPRTNELLPGIAPSGAKPVAIRNPMASDLGEMRLSVLGGLLDAMRENLNQGERSGALFHLGKVFWRDERGEAREAHRVGGLCWGGLPRQGLGSAAEGDFLDLKGLVELILEGCAVAPTWERRNLPPHFHPGLAASIWLPEGGCLGIAGALHPTVLAEVGVDSAAWAFELDAEILLQYPRLHTYRELPKFPAVGRDLAIVTQVDFAAAEVPRFVRKWRNEWIETVQLFDQYMGPPIPEGKKSLAYSITYRAADRTLTDEEVNQVHQELTAALTAALGVELRS